jgi:peptide subunit release factor 1 (eRF1)
VRLGTYAIGVSGGENLVSCKTGTGLVHGRHRQGGSSAHRFERHRDKQIEYFLTRVCQHIREQWEPHAKTLDYVVYGGAWTTMQLLQKRCPFLERLATPALPPLLDIPEPNRSVLETAVKRVWSSTVMEWRED